MPALTRGFLKWFLHEKGNTAHRVKAQKSALAWWLGRLRGVNLRRATVRDHLAPALEGAPGTIKAFYGWLRKVEHDITAGEDPTIDPVVPQGKPAQWSKSRVIPR